MVSKLKFNARHRSLSRNGRPSHRNQHERQRRWRHRSLRSRHNPLLLPCSQRKTMRQSQCPRQVSMDECIVAKSGAEEGGSRRTSPDSRRANTNRSCLASRVAQEWGTHGTDIPRVGRPKPTSPSQGPTSRPRRRSSPAFRSAAGLSSKKARDCCREHVTLESPVAARGAGSPHQQHKPSEATGKSTVWRELSGVEESPSVNPAMVPAASVAAPLNRIQLHLTFGGQAPPVVAGAVRQLLPFKQFEHPLCLDVVRLFRVVLYEPAEFAGYLGRAIHSALAPCDGRAHSTAFSSRSPRASIATAAVSSTAGQSRGAEIGRPRVSLSVG